MGNERLHCLVQYSSLLRGALNGCFIVFRTACIVRDIKIHDTEVPIVGLYIILCASRVPSSTNSFSSP